MARPAQTLPEETQPRIFLLVERSAPDPDRPRMESETERAFACVDRESAACYASCEDLSHQLRKSAARADEIACSAWPPDED